MNTLHKMLEQGLGRDQSFIKRVIIIPHKMRKAVSSRCEKPEAQN